MTLMYLIYLTINSIHIYYKNLGINKEQVPLCFF